MNTLESGLMVSLGAAISATKRSHMPPEDSRINPLSIYKRVGAEQGAVEGELSAIAWMRDLEPVRVQHQPRGRRAAVEQVADDGMADRRQMHADLMGAS